ncbi:MAG: phosphate/phosphonate ABC transporter permease, partial [Armatimonadetes bacterium]|nr:phosphate/phosphonate ABC transporter permease [Armatimonadota bacterium]
MSGLRIGLQLTVVNTYSGAVWGDEVMAVGLADALRAQPEVSEAEVYSSDTIHDNLDLVISFYAWPETRLVTGPRQVWWYQAPRLNREAGPAVEAASRYEAVLVAGPRLGQEATAAGAKRLLFVPMSANPAVYHPARAALNVFRSVDTLVYALVFVAAVGLGPFPGVLAVVAYTTTSLAKLTSEAIEGVDPGPVDAITATGATRLQVLRFGVLPQVLPLFLSYVLYRLETNIRAATVLGFVGAGGIGFYLQTYLRMIDYPAASTVLLVTVGMVIVVDGLSARLRA